MEPLQPSSFLYEQAQVPMARRRSSFKRRRLSYGGGRKFKRGGYRKYRRTYSRRVSSLRSRLRRGGSPRTRKARICKFIYHRHFFGRQVVAKWVSRGYATYTSSAGPVALAQLIYTNGSPAFTDSSNTFLTGNYLSDPAFLGLTLGSNTWNLSTFGGFGGLLAQSFRRHIILGAKITFRVEPVSTSVTSLGMIYLGAFNNDQTLPTLSVGPWDDISEMRGFKVASSFNTISGGAITARGMKVTKYFKSSYYDKMFKLDPESYGGTQLNTGAWTKATKSPAIICMGIGQRDNTNFAANTFLYRCYLRTTWYVRFWEPNIILDQ